VSVGRRQRKLPAFGTKDLVSSGARKRTVTHNNTQQLTFIVTCNGPSRLTQQSDVHGNRFVFESRTMLGFGYGTLGARVIFFKVVKVLPCCCRLPSVFVCLSYRLITPLANPASWDPELVRPPPVPSAALRAPPDTVPKTAGFSPPSTYPRPRAVFFT